MTLATVLVVDDSVIGRYATARLLRSAGYDVREAGSGRQALGFLLEPPALVVLDIALQDIDGFEVCRRFKDHPRGRGVPVVMKTAVYREPDHERQARLVGASEYLVEPVPPERLLSAVKRLLEADNGARD